MRRWRQLIAVTVIFAIGLLAVSGSLAQVGVELTEDGKMLASELDQAQASGRLSLRRLMARVDLERIVETQNPAGRIFLLLQLSRAQRRVDASLTLENATYLQRAVKTFLSTPTDYQVAVVLESILVQRNVLEPSAAQLDLVNTFVQLPTRSVVAAVRAYGERTSSVFDAAKRLARKAKQHELVVALARKRVDVAVEESGEISAQHAVALAQWSDERIKEKSSLDDFSRAAELYERATASGSDVFIEEAIDVFNSYAENMARLGRQDAARAALTSAQRVARATTRLRLDRSQGASVADDVMKTARLLRDQSRRDESIALLRYLEGWATIETVELRDRGEVIRALAGLEIMAGNFVSANTRIDLLETMLDLDLDERPTLEKHIRDLRSMLRVVQMIADPLPREIFAEKYLAQARSATLTPKQAGELLEMITNLRLDNRASILKAAFENRLIEQQPALHARFGIELALVQEKLFDVQAALATLNKCSQGLRSTRSNERSLLALASFHRGKLQFQTSSYAAAEASFKVSLAIWSSGSARRQAESLVVAHWLARAQMASAALDRAAETLQALRKMTVDADREVTRSISIASIDAEIRASRGATSEAKAVLAQALMEIAGDFGEKKDWGPMPMWPLAAAMRSFSEPLNAIGVVVLSQQLLQLMNRTCDTDHSLMLALFQVQQTSRSSPAQSFLDDRAVTQRLVTLDETLWGSDMLVDLAVQAARLQHSEVAQLAYLQIGQQQAQSISGVPRVENGFGPHRNDLGLHRVIGLGQERELMNARSAEEATRIFLRLGMPTSSSSSIILNPVKKAVIPGGSFVELIVFVPSTKDGVCLSEAQRQPHVGIFAIDNGELHVSMGMPLKALRAQEQALFKAIISRRDSEANQRARALYEELLRSAVSKLTADVVNIRADTGVSNIPFSYLLWAGSELRAARLQPIGIVPDSRPNPAADNIVVYANPAYGQPRPGQQPSLGALEEGEVEADHIGSAFRANVALFKGHEATVASLLLQRHPGVLHLATHAFIDERFGGTHKETTDRVARLAQAMTTTRLALANANENAPGLWSTGIMSSLSLASLDLRGTQLVVFSACDTGVATHNVGYLTTGLGLSAHLAGARTVVSTLWPVWAAASPVFMQQFYMSLAAGAVPSKALAAAQDFMRGHPDFSAPLYWAGYVVSGDDVPVVIARCATCAATP